MAFASASNIGDGLEAEEAKGISVLVKPLHHSGHLGEVVVGDGDGGGGLEGDSGDLTDFANEIGGGVSNGGEFLFVQGALDTGASALSGVDVDADFAQSVVADERDEVFRFFEEALAMTHDHQVEADGATVSDDTAEVCEGKEGDFTSGDLNFAPSSEGGAEVIELFLDFDEGERLGFVGILSEVAAGAREVALLHDVMGGSAKDGAPSCDLVSGFYGFGQVLPALLQERGPFLAVRWGREGHCVDDAILVREGNQYSIP